MFIWNIILSLNNSLSLALPWQHAGWPEVPTPKQTVPSSFLLSKVLTFELRKNLERELGPQTEQQVKAVSKHNVTHRVRWSTPATVDPRVLWIHKTLEESNYTQNSDF